MAKLIIVILLTVNVAFAAKVSINDVKQKEIKITVIETADFVSPKPKDKRKRILAESEVGDGYCVIRLKKYPKCLLHEMRHCLEGDWHEGKETRDDC